MHLPNHLCRYRKKFALTQKEVGRFLGVDASTISRIEAGAEPSITCAIGCAYLFGEPLSEFFPTLVSQVRENAIPALATFSIQVEHEDEGVPATEQRRAFLAQIAEREDYETNPHAL